jgi:2Fe-2S iron-sulfur cluster binding domain
MKLVVNGAEVDVDDRHAKTPLLWVLRDVLGLHGTKFDCGAGYCAACTVPLRHLSAHPGGDSRGRGNVGRGPGARSAQRPAGARGRPVDCRRDGRPGAPVHPDP